LSDARLEIKVLRNCWKYVHCVLCFKHQTQAVQRLQTGLRLRDGNATMTSMKWEDSYDSGHGSE